MTVKQLINMLLDCDMSAEVEVITENTDSNGKAHVYSLTGIDKHGVYNGMSGRQYISIKIHNWEFDKKGEN